MSKLQNKVAVVTGGNSGIGLATAKLFKEEGASVVVFGRNEETVRQTEQELGGETLGVVGDVSKLSDLENLYSQVKERFGNIDILYANAGVFGGSPVTDVDEQHFDWQFDVNVKGAYFTIQKALPLLNDGASVLINSSVANVKGMSGMSVYSATKAAVRSFARTLATELAPKGIRVNSISPGPIETPILERTGMPAEQVKQTKDYLTSLVPLNRMGEAKELASAALFLASNDSSYVNGIDLAADDGMTQV